MQDFINDEFYPERYYSNLFAIFPMNAAVSLNCHPNNFFLNVHYIKNTFFVYEWR